MTMASTSAWVERDGMLFSPALTSLGLIAGFTTRAQGSMAGSQYPLDEQARNRATLAKDLGFAEITRTKQVHGRDVVRVDRQVEPWPVADGQWTDTPGVLLGVAAADCVPILVADPSGPIGVAHAGWEGTTRRVAQALVEAMVAGGASRERLVAALGPSIGPCCYVIDEARAAKITEALGGEALSRDRERIVFDLWRANAVQLEEAGVRRVEVSALCTLSGGADLWSYRGRGADGMYGTQLGFLGRPGGKGPRSPSRARV
jgi:polyphenol oxidase